MIIIIATDEPDPLSKKQLKTAINTPPLLSPFKYSWLLFSLLISSLSFADSSANIGLASNYLWRGITQSDKNLAASGGLDYSADSGFYIGTWVSTLTGGSYELDLYGGFSKEVNSVTYDVGIISYQYPNDNDYFNEVYFSTTYSSFVVGMAYTFDSKDNSSPAFSQGDYYLSLGYSHELASGIQLAETIGHYEFDNALGDDYNHLIISASKSNFTLAIDTTSGLTQNNDTTLSLAWSKAFNLK